MFSEEERAVRDATYRNLAERATVVMLSSQTARGHFEAFAPGLCEKVRVLPFPSLFAFEPPSGAPQETVQRFRLPPKFALVVNQIWGHKNHRLVVEAAARAKAAGTLVPIVMAGMPADYRDPTNESVSALLQSIAREGVAGSVIVLGRVSRGELVDLMRAATVLIQPSRFEGWSTSVEDAKALGRPLLCSDLEVHREQAPGALGYFSVDDPAELAALLVEHWARLDVGPDAAAERAALAVAREGARAHGQALWRLCREASGLNR